VGIYTSAPLIFAPGGNGKSCSWAEVFFSPSTASTLFSSLPGGGGNRAGEGPLI
jgi:hypothetical protein